MQNMENKNAWFSQKKEGKPKIYISENINSRLTKDSTTITLNSK